MHRPLGFPVAALPAADQDMLERLLDGRLDPADQGQRAESVAFKALVEAAGGADKVAAYCKDVAPGGSAGAHGQRPAAPPSVSAPSTSISPPSSGPPADPGPPASTGPGGHGQGGPPTTSGEASRTASSGPPVQVV